MFCSLAHETRSDETARENSWFGWGLFWLHLFCLAPILPLRQMEGILAGPQKKKLLEDPDLEAKVIVVEVKTWNAFMNVVKNAFVEEKLITPVNLWKSYC